MADSETKTWGEWVKARASRVGFVRRNDLARTIGCSEDQLSRWIAMDVPPRLMRKQFDQRMATALQIDHQTLFVTWRETPPFDAPLLAGTVVVSEEITLRRKVLAIVELLDAPQLGRLHDVGRELLAAGMTHKAVA